jgi:hypothetical protein
MTYPPELQAYYDAHDAMMDEERNKAAHRHGWWIWQFGLYKVARYNAVKAGYLPETPEFG